MWFRGVGRLLTLILSLLVAPLTTDAQQPAKVPRIGALMLTLHPERARNLEAFRQGLHDLGWVEGQNLAIECRFAEQGAEQFAELAADLVRLKVDVLVVAGGARAVRVAKEATSTIPIVMISGGDAPTALREGLIASLAEPGGNITGTVSLNPELMQRRLELLKEAVPRVSRLAVLLNRANPSAVSQLHEAQVAAQALGVELHVLEPRSPDEFASAFATMQQAGVDALLVLADPLLLEPHGNDITALALQHRLPATYLHRMYVDAGGLMYYGTGLREAYRRTAYYVDRILKGAKPASLPVEMPWKFEFVINLKTARALGLTLPPTLLFQADEVIQ